VTITEELSRGVTVLTMKGRFLGEPETSAFQEQKFRLLEANRINIVLDLSDMTLINSAGLGSLIAALVSTRDRGGDLRLARLSKVVEQVIQKVQLDSTFKIFRSVEEAVSSFGQR